MVAAVEEAAVAAAEETAVAVAVVAAAVVAAAAVAAAAVAAHTRTLVALAPQGHNARKVGAVPRFAAWRSGVLIPHDEPSPSFPLDVQKSETVWMALL